VGLTAFTTLKGYYQAIVSRARCIHKAMGKKGEKKF
jgi:hypothetical protein